MLRQALREARVAVLGYGLGLGAMALVTVLSFPALEDFQRLQEQLLAAYPEELLALFGAAGVADLFSPEGFLHSQLFAFMAPLLLLIQGIGAGAHAVAGEEERGTLELVLAQPVSRLRYYGERLAALWLQLAATGAVLAATIAAGAAAVDMPLDPARLAAAVVNTVLLGGWFGSLALGVGAAAGRRRAALGVSALVAVAAYFVNGLAPLVDALEPLRPLSPFYHAVGYLPLKEGFAPVRAAGLLGTALVLAAAGAVRFARRDLGA